MFEAMTFQGIMQRMLARVPDDMDKREGSMIWDAMAPAALELEMAYITMEYAIMQAFADTADREHLILKCRERAIFPKGATQALLRGLFTPATVDVIGRRFNLGRLNYIVEGSIEGEPGAYYVRCETLGEEGNQRLGNLIPIEYVDGLETAKLVAVLIPGKEEESTKSLRQRYFDSFGIKAFGGNIRDYLDKINAMDGVGGTRITPVWRGGRTVKATIIDSSYNRASDTLIASVQAVIDPLGDGCGTGLAPIDHVVTVDTAPEVPINVSVRVEFTGDSAWEASQAAMEEAIGAYLLELRKEWGSGMSGDVTIVRLSQIETRLLQLPGVVDVGDATINGQPANLTITDNGIPIMGVLERAEDR